MSARRLTVGVTRAPEDAEALLRTIEALGGRAVAMPTTARVAVQPPAEQMRWAQALWPRLAAVALGSRPGAQALAAHLHATGETLPASCALYAVGPETAATAQRALGRPVRAPAREAGARALLPLLLPELPPGSAVLLPGAAQMRPELADALRAAGHTPLPLALYETVPRAAGPTVTGEAAMDYIVFASPSSVDGFVRWGLPFSGARMLSIGPSTSAALRAHGLGVHREAAPSTLTGLLALLRDLLCPRPPR